ncbi:MAG: ABC transporter ATP-binding protein [Anaerolineales bacterium]|nr:ABC transporter ATP-binding protein [Anaerolineales bacterium]
MSELILEDVRIRYQHQRTGQWIQATDSVSFQAATGQFTALIGPSGSGKSSLLNAIAGVQPLESGQILFDNQPVCGPSQDRAMVFQSPSLLPWRSVLRNVTYGLELQRMPLTEAKARARNYLELVGLQAFAESYPAELSGGMQQRVNLARALALHPRLLLFDEPLSALDAQLRDQMQLELLRIWRRLNITAVYVTHQIREAIFLADQIVVLSPSPGRVIEIIPVDLPRPRQIELRHSKAFLNLESHLWELLRSENALQLA